MRRHGDLVQFGPSFAVSSSENSKARLGSRARSRASSQLTARFHLLLSRNLSLCCQVFHC